MSDSASRLGDVVGERAAGAIEPVVEVDAGGEREHALDDAGAQVVQRAGAVAFEASRSLAVQKIDSMRWRMAEMRGPLSGSSARAGRTRTAPRSPMAAANSRPA